MYVQKEYPDFSWSNSRHKTFLECKRKYYYYYYESHNGWLNEAKEEQKSSYRLKNLRSLPIILGEEIHKAIDLQIKNFLSGKRLFTEDEMIKLVSRGLNEAFLDSTKRQQQWLARPKNYKMLHEIYYELELRQDEIDLTKRKLVQCAQRFFHCPTYLGILNNLELQVLKSEDFRIFELNGVDVYVVLDFVYKDLSQEKWVVIDWKTGKESEDDRQQLAFYALYLSREHGIPVEDIIIRNEYLQSGTSREYKLTQFDIDTAQEIMNNSIHFMLEMLEDKVQNKPLSIDHFEMSSSKRCMSCNFKEKCIETLS